jgi:hypothetical protein
MVNASTNPCAGCHERDREIADLQAKLIAIEKRLKEVEHCSCVDGDKCLRSHSNVPSDLSQQYRGNVSSLVERYGCPATVRMAELFVGSTLPYLVKSEFLKARNDLARLENRKLRHRHDT